MLQNKKIKYSNTHFSKLPKEKKHILILSSWYPTLNEPFLGNFVKRQAELLSTKFQVTVLITKADSAFKKREISDKKNGFLREIIVYYPKARTILQKILRENKAFKKGLELVTEVDLIHGHVLLPKGFQFISAKKYFNCPLLVTEHGSYFRPEVKEKRTFLEKLILRNSSNKIDQLTCVSEFLKRDLQEEFPSTDIQILPNHVAIQSFKPEIKLKSKKKEFLHISTLDEQVKNPKGIIDACLTLLQDGEINFHLTVISDEPFQKWENYAKDHQLGEYITFLGPLAWTDLVQYYQRSDAFILFSSYETFSIVLAESWACGVPTITTSVGIGDNISPSLGIQIEKNNTHELAAAMQKVIQEEISFDPHVISAYAQQYSEQNILLTFEKLLFNLVKQ